MDRVPGENFKSGSVLSSTKKAGGALFCATRCVLAYHRLGWSNKKAKSKINTSIESKTMENVSYAVNIIYTSPH